MLKDLTKPDLTPQDIQKLIEKYQSELKNDRRKCVPYVHYQNHWISLNEYTRIMKNEE